jgi:hypothetical protein
MSTSAKPRTYGYEENLLSNSMLQAAITCPVKYKLLYEDRIQGMDGTYFNAAWVGTVVHECIELFDNDFEGARNHLWVLLEEFVGKALASRTKSMVGLYRDARDKTYADVRKWGKEPKAPPEMYGYWKKNYGGLEALMAKLCQDVEEYVGENGEFEEKYTDLVQRMLVCLDNWPAMRIGDPVAVEIQIKGEVGPDDAKVQMVGTVDRLEDRGNGRIAICDHKTGRWGYDDAKLGNSDQFGLYHTILAQQGYTITEWVVYDLFLGKVVRIVPDSACLGTFHRRLATNLRYFQQLKQSIGAGIEVPTPAGSAFKTGCPCILAQTGHCPYVYTP